VLILQQLLQDTREGLLQIQQQDLPLLRQPVDWQNKYRVLMQLGKKLPALPEKMRQNEYLVRGCESRAWLLHYHDEQQDKHFFVLDSEARIVKGLLAVMLSLVNGMSSKELQQFELQKAFDMLNLKPYLSLSRGNGLSAMMQRIKAVVS
jgi:cysteine desulfuration protein SufE